MFYEPINFMEQQAICKFELKRQKKLAYISRSVKPNKLK